MTTIHGKAEIVRLLAQFAYREEPTRLSSGKRSDYYLDAKVVSYTPEGAALIGAAVWSLIKNERVDAVGGLTLGADAIVVSTTLAARTEGVSLPGFIVRKEPKKHGLKKRIEGAVPPEGSRVAIVDDVVTLGGSVLDAVDAARDAKLTVVVVVPLVDREEGARQAIEDAGLTFRPICTASEVRDAFHRAHSPAFA